MCLYEFRGSVHIYKSHVKWVRVSRVHFLGLGVVVGCGEGRGGSAVVVVVVGDAVVLWCCGAVVVVGRWSVGKGMSR